MSPQDQPPATADSCPVTESRVNTQTAPFPDDLADLITRLRYRPGWRFALDDIVRDPASSHGAEARGLTFIVTTKGYDSYHPERGDGYRVNHYFPVPAATYNRASWRRWLFDCLLRVETHETMEFFALARDCCPTLATHVATFQREVADGHLSAFVTREPTGPDGVSEWHLSISHRTNERPPKAGRYPTWDEITHARYELLPADLTFSMLLPPQSEYVAVHDTTFHLYETHPGQVSAVTKGRRRRAR